MNTKEEDLSFPIHGKREISTKQPSTGERWDYRGTTVLQRQYTYCSLRGDDLERDLPSWEATAQLLSLTVTSKPKTTKRILELMFKITTEWLDISDPDSTYMHVCAYV